MHTLAEMFTLLLANLKAAIARRPAEPLARTAYVDLIWKYISRTNGRFQRLFARWKAGTLPKPRAPRPGEASTGTGTRTRAPASPQPFRPQPFPPHQAKGWLLREIPGLGASRSQIRHWIANTPELHEFLAAAPQARRLLNPLCWMLGIDLDAPLGVPLVTAPASPDAKPEPAASPPPAPPRGVQCPSQSTETAPNPPLVFSGT